MTSVCVCVHLPSSAWPWLACACACVSIHLSHPTQHAWRGVGREVARDVVGILGHKESEREPRAFIGFVMRRCCSDGLQQSTTNPEHDTFSRLTKLPYTMSKYGPATAATVVKLLVPACQASAQPPVGPALGSKGVKAMDFAKQLFVCKWVKYQVSTLGTDILNYSSHCSNEVTKHLQPGLPTPTIVNIAADRTFTFEIRSEHRDGGDGTQQQQQQQQSLTYLLHSFPSQHRQHPSSSNEQQESN